MSRVITGLKKLAELYLVILGGGYALAFCVGLIANGRTDGDYRQAIGFFVAIVFLSAGIGIHKNRLWGLILAMILAVLTIAFSLSERRSVGVWDYHDVTITLPMALIFVWAILPPTWTRFGKRETGAA